MADILNCKNKFSKRNFDSPLTEENYHRMKGYYNNFISYIKMLKDANSTAILKSNRKTVFLGIIICLTNIFPLFNKLQSSDFTYLLTYKLSQDYLDTFLVPLGVGGLQ